MIEFTRYLYIKQDVETALIGSLLNKDKDLALFWAFELFHSGFTQGALLVLWNTYYGFYATESPAMESYMKKREATMDPEEFIVTFVSNLVIRPSNTDVFFLSGAAQKTEEDDDYVEWDLTKRLKEENYEAIAHALVIMSKEKSKLTKAKKQLSTYFESKGVKRPTFAVVNDLPHFAEQLPRHPDARLVTNLRRTGTTSKSSAYFDSKLDMSFAISSCSLSSMSSPFSTPYSYNSFASFNTSTAASAHSHAVSKEFTSISAALPPQETKNAPAANNITNFFILFYICFIQK